MEIATLIDGAATERAGAGLNARITRALSNLFRGRAFTSPRVARAGLARGYELMAARRAAAGDARGAAYYAAHSRALAAVAA